MKSLGVLLRKKDVFQKKTILDEKTAFYIFREVIKEEFGKQGASKLIPDYFSDKTIFVKFTSSAWASELRLTRQEIIKKINEKLGGRLIKEIKFK
jgi:predicted nucleic acid-binding Zn ribbon protein